MIRLLPLALLLGGCVNTQEAIAPATIDDLTLGICADVEMWFQYGFLFFGI